MRHAIEYLRYRIYLYTKGKNPILTQKNHWSDDNWLESMCEVANKWLRNPPKVETSEYFKHPLTAKILGVNRNRTLQSWQTAALIDGLFDNNQEIPDYLINKWLKDDYTWRKQPETIDQAFLANQFLIHGIHSNLKIAMYNIYELIVNNIQPDGTICYRDNINKYRFVDTIGFICPFLMSFSKIYGVDNAAALAHRQIEDYIEYGLDEGGIPFHGYNALTHEKIGAKGWGRGIGWYILGLEAFGTEYMNEKYRLAKQLICYQQSDGGFPWLVNFDGICETTGTSLIGCLFLDCYEATGGKEFKTAAEQCVKAIKASTLTDGTVWNAQGDSAGLALYSNRFDRLPFAQGYAIKLAKRAKSLD